MEEFHVELLDGALLDRHKETDQQEATRHLDNLPPVEGRLVLGVEEGDGRRLPAGNGGAHAEQVPEVLGK